jgi:glycerophosphoryl diester phosphodiesterase
MIHLLSLLIGFSAYGLDVEGHRGARAMRPENTLPAFQYALEVGVTTIELDLAVTSDNVLVISHDPFINPEHCQGPHGEVVPESLMIHSLTAAKVQEFDCGSKKNPHFPNQQPVPQTPIARFNDLLRMLADSKLANAKTIHLNVETKIYPSAPELTPTPKQFVELIVKLLRQYKIVNRTTLESFDDRTLLAAKKLEPKLQTVLLTSDNHIDYVAAVKAAHADFLSPDSNWILPEDVQALPKNGIKVIPWTVNDPAGWDRLLKMGVDGIISDDPAALLAFLKK